MTFVNFFNKESIKSLKDQIQQREQNKQDWDKSVTIENITNRVKQYY